LKESLKTSLFKKSASLIIASFFGIGYLPPCPGTFGALGGALVFWFLLKSLSLPLQIFFTAILFLIGVFTSFQVSKISGNEDPEEVVIDEVVGMWLALIGRHTLFEFFIAFVFFRIFDIKKPFYIAKVERIPNGWGIMLDDVLAGIYSWISLSLVLYLREILPFVKM